MDFVARTLRWQRIVLAVVLVGSAVGFWRGSLDVFNTTKATIVALGALALLTLSALRVSMTRRALIPATAAWYPMGAFAAALVVATLVADRPMLAVVGRIGRHTGLVMYLVYVMLVWAVLRQYHDASPAPLIKAILVAAVPVSLYGLAQAVGLEPLPWQAVEGGPPVFSTFGNANFFSAYLGIVVPLALWGALTSTWSELWRAASGLLAVLSLLAAYLSGSLQGVGIALLGAAFVVAVAVLSSDEAAHRRGRAAAAAGAVLVTAGAAIASVAFGVGPLGHLQPSAARSLETRIGKWETALAMFADRPLIGFGLDSFGDWFYAYRPQWLAVTSGLERSTDTPHNVFLDMLASGGLVLGLSYAAFVGFTAWALASGLRRLAGEERLLLGGLGGGWLAYQLQSLVSIDVPPLAVAHWVLAGAIILVANRPPLREWTLPGASAPAAQRPGARRRPRDQAPALARPNPIAIGLIAVLVVIGVWALAIPLRAEEAASDALHLAAVGRLDEAEQAWDSAVGIGFWEARYPAMAGGFHTEQLGRLSEALALHQTAARREPRGLAHWINVGRIAVSLGEEATAEEAYQRILELDRQTPEVLAEVGRYRLERGDAAEAARLLGQAVEARDENAEWWVALGRARSGAGDDAGARRAFERALQIDPEADDARDGLEQLAERA
ncbi:MAG TPA: tetratricopeptide repeat protein [Egibacteraceae bacterium]|nr:tetratricopeptide repeat protein [Egibacteraceae bacterium]